MEINEIYRKNFPFIKSFIKQNNGTLEDAQDIFQEAVLIAWYNYRIGKFDQSKGTIDAYVCTIAKNKWIDQLRKNKKYKVQNFQNFVEREEKNKHDYEEKEQKIAKLLFTFHQIGDKCKEILEAYYYQKQKLETIAEKFGTNADVIKTQKSRCLEKIKQMINANR